MRTFSTDSWVYRWFNNSLTSRFPKAPLFGPPDTDCSFFWSFLWNGAVYLWMLITILFAPMMFLSTFVGIGSEMLVDFYGAPEWVRNDYFMDGVRLVMDTLFDQSNPYGKAWAMVFVMFFGLAPFIAGMIGAVVVLFIIPLALAIAAISYAAVIFSDWYKSMERDAAVRTQAGEPSPLFIIARDRVAGFFGKFCTPIQWEDSSEK